jgi:hypothetical protein
MRNVSVRHARYLKGVIALSTLNDTSAIDPWWTVPERTFQTIAGKVVHGDRVGVCRDRVFGCSVLELVIDSLSLQILLFTINTGSEVGKI